VGKSFDYWKKINDDGLIKIYAIDLQLAHLKYAADQILITNEEYCAHRLRITDQCIPSYEFKPCTLMDFGKSLKEHYLKKQQEINKLNKKYIYTVKDNVINTSGNIIQQSNAIKGFNSMTEQENRQTKKKKKNRRKKKKLNNSICDLNYDFTDNDVIKNIAIAKEPVKIFTRTKNKKYLSETINKEIDISTKMSVREIFSKLLKQYKRERQLLQC